MHESDRKVDRRVQRTRALLQRAMIELIGEKGYEATSIQDITDRANVARTTFYLHYSDRDELLFSSVREMVEELLSAMNPEDKGAPKGFEHISEHADFYRAILGEQGSPAFISRLREVVADVVREYVLRRMTPPGREPRVPLDFMAHYLVGAYVSVAAWWLNNDMPFSAAEMAQMVDSLADKGVSWATGAGEPQTEV